ncbi:MAG: PilZ domain-containing protein [Sphingomonas sp.]|nr:PilZ domain-containing protein [Sphingomonas sp.]
MQRVHGWIGRKDRHPVSLDAVVYRDEGESAPVRLTNLTDEGCRIEADHHFRIGERVEIAIPGVGRMKAQVRWALHKSAGAKFVGDQA